MDPETVVETIQTDAAQTAAHEAAVQVSIGTEIVAAEVAAVSDELTEHAEVSEERHEEILGDTEWIRNQLAQLSTILQTCQTTLAAVQAGMTAEFQTLRTMIESTVMPPSIPVQAEVLEVVEPESAGVVLPVPETPPADPARKKRRAI